MLKQLLLFVCLLVTANMQAQQNVGIGTSTPNASAQLDITATNKGLLIPRMNTAAITAISNPAKGLLVLDTARNQLVFNIGTSGAPNWQTISFNSGWGTTGNAATNPATNFIGTTDNADVIFKRGNVAAGRINESEGLTALGVGALNSVQLFSFANTAIGSYSLASNSDGQTNTAVGGNSLTSNTSGSQNTAVGGEAMYTNTLGGYSTALGHSALFSNVSGNDNTAVGRDCLYFTTGSGNTALGFDAGFRNGAGSGNVFIGYRSGTNDPNLSNRLYIDNARSGNQSLIYGEFDNRIVSIGGNLGIGTTTPTTAKLVIATNPGNNGIDLASNDAYAEMRVIRNTLSTQDNDLYFGYEGPTGSSLHLFSDGNETMLVKSDLIGVGKTPLTSDNDSRLQVKQKGNQNGIGVEAENSSNHWDFYTSPAVASNFGLLYNGVLKGVFDNTTGNYIAISDRRMKKDITPQVSVLGNVLQLQAYQYHYLDNQPTDRFSNGFMAQDVQKIFPDAVVENEMKDGEKRLGINYQYFTVLAIKGMQEQQHEIELLKEQMNTLIKEVSLLKKQ